MYIGIIERLMIAIMMLHNYLSGIAFVLAIKSFVRYKALDNKMFSEYYLLGTMLSFTYAVIMYYTLS